MHRLVSLGRHRAVRSFVFASTPRSLVAASDTKRQFWETTPTLADKTPEAGPFASASEAGESPPAAVAAPKEKAPKAKKEPPELVRPVSAKSSHTVYANDIANSVSVMHALPKTKSKEIVESVFKLMALTLQEKIPISLSGFGTFKVAVSKARTARNPITGAAVEVPEKNRLSFKAYPGLKASLQEGYVPPPPKTRTRKPAATPPNEK